MKDTKNTKKTSWGFMISKWRNMRAWTPHCPRASLLPRFVFFVTFVCFAINNPGQMIPSSASASGATIALLS